MAVVAGAAERSAVVAGRVVGGDVGAGVVEGGAGEVLLEGSVVLPEGLGDGFGVVLLPGAGLVPLLVPLPTSFRIKSKSGISTSS